MNVKVPLKIQRKFKLDPSIALYLPFYDLDGGVFTSRDQFQRAVTKDNTIWTPRGHLFNGSTSYMTTGTTSTFQWMHGAEETAFQFTIIAYLNISSFAVARAIMDTAINGASTDVGFWLYVGTDRTIIFSIRRGVIATSVVALSSTNLYPNDTTGYHQVAVTYDHALSSGNAKLFIDGGYLESATKTADAPSGAAQAGALLIGQFTANVNVLSGTLSELFIYRRALSNMDIVNHSR